jgi:SSS family solute:Na+ symporter
MVFTDVLANEPIYFGLIASLVTYIVVSLATKPTPAAVLEVWNGRLSGRDVADADDPAHALASHEVRDAADEVPATEPN